MRASPPSAPRGTRERRRPPAARPECRARHRAHGAAAPGRAHPRGAQLVDPAARQKRRVHLEVGVLGGRAHEDHGAVLHRGQQGVLLCLVEAVDLVEEEDRALAARVEPVPCAVDHRPHLGPARVHRGGLLERRPSVHREQPGERGLARARRPVQDHRVRPALLERRPQRRPSAEQVLLADELPERCRPHARGERLPATSPGRAPSPRPRSRTAALPPIGFSQR